MNTTTLSFLASTPADLASSEYVRWFVPPRLLTPTDHASGFFLITSMRSRAFTGESALTVNAVYSFSNSATGVKSV